MMREQGCNSSPTDMHESWTGLTECMCVLQALRVRVLQEAYHQAELAHERQGAPQAGQVRSLGLLDKKE